MSLLFANAKDRFLRTGPISCKFVFVWILKEDNSCFVCLFGLILYIPSTIFQLNRKGLPGLNQY